MGKSTNLLGFSWSRGSSTSSGLIVGATFASSCLASVCFASISDSRAERSASRGLFSLPAEKSSFLTGDSIWKLAMPEAAW